MHSVPSFHLGLQINSLPCAVGRLLAVALVSVVVGSFAVTAAVAQGGSTGGTVGKIDKSQSGADAAPSVQPESKAGKPAKRAGASRNIATSSCSKMPGNWSWFNFNNVVISPNGTATAGPFSATWSCKDDSVVMHWSHGYIDRLTLSRNGTHLEGTNGSVTVTGDRK